MTETAPPKPRPTLPDIPGPWETALRFWRRLRRMSTALLLLFSLASASIVATFVPQRPLVPSTVTSWLAGDAGPGAGIAEVFDTLGLFDVFAARWFALLVTLLFVSLTGCLLPRWRGFLRVVRKPAPVGRNLERLSHSVEWQSILPPEEALAAAGRVLRGYRTRRVDSEVGAPRLAAERGHSREGGSLIFHSAFYLLLLGVVIGKAFGFQGQVNVTEGSAFADTRIAYDQVEPGRWFGLDDHRGFVVALDDFDVSYFPNLVPKDFVSRVRVLENGEEVQRGVTRVNHPLRYRGMKLYQIRYGMAPRVVVRSGDTLLFDEPVMMGDSGGGVWTGAAKVSLGARSAGRESGPQIALDLVFLPDATVTADGVPANQSPQPHNPRLIAELYVGDGLGLEQPIPASQFTRDPAALIGAPVVLAPGGQADMAAGNLTVEFPELRMWSGFQVSHAPGRRLLLAAGILLLTGLIPSLYSYRRRVWVHATPEGSGSRIRVAGVALQRKPSFADEFDRLHARLRAVLPSNT